MAFKETLGSFGGKSRCLTEGRNGIGTQLEANPAYAHAPFAYLSKTQGVFQKLTRAFFCFEVQPVQSGQ